MLRDALTYFLSVWVIHSTSSRHGCSVPWGSFKKAKIPRPQGPHGSISGDRDLFMVMMLVIMTMMAIVETNIYCTLNNILHSVIYPYLIILISF